MFPRPPLCFASSARRTALTALGLVAFLLGCSSQSTGPGAAAATPAAAAPTVASTTRSSPSTPPSGPSAVPAPAGTRPELPVSRPLAFERVLPEKVRSIALGRPRVAVLADEPWWFDKGRWQRLPRPEHLRPVEGQTEQVEVYFGRDDKLRIMGFRPATSSTKLAQVYQRHTPQGWIADKSEIGRFTAGPAAPLYGVLGHDDPEVVCKPGEACIVKRLTGWQTIPEVLGPSRVVLCGAAVWAVNERRVAELTATGWRPRDEPVPWQAPGGAFEVPGRGLWVPEPLVDRLHRLENNRWVTEPAPIARPREVWASSSTDVWLVGDGGAAHHDGQRWTRVDGVGAPLARVLGRSPGDVWLGGESGLWHGTR